MTQSSRAVPETGVDSGVASASVRPEPSSVEAAGRLTDLTLGLNEATRTEIAKLFTETLSEAQAIVMSMIFMPGVRAALDNLPADDPVGPYLEKARQYEAKDRELAEARAEIERSELGRHRLGHALREAESKAADADWWKSRALRSERERDEAMAALREKEEARVSLSRSLNHAAKVQVELEDRVKALEEALSPFADEKTGVMQDLLWGDQPDSASMTITCPLGWVRRARSVLSSVQPVSGSREQRGNEEG